MIGIATASFIEDAKRLEHLMDSLEVVTHNMNADVDCTHDLQHHRDTVKELKDRIMDLSPLVDKILEDIEDL